MNSFSRLTPSTPIQYLKGVGPKLAKVFEKKSVHTAWDMLFYLPIRYIDRRKLSSIRELKMGEKESFIAQIVDYGVSSIRKGRKKILEVAVTDGKDHAIITFFQFNESYMKKKFPVGSSVLFFGEARFYKGLKNLVHPEMELWDEDVQTTSRIMPLYPLTEGLYQKTVRNILSKNLERLLEIVEEDPRSVRDSGKVQISLIDAFRNIHKPQVEDDIDSLNLQKSPYHQRIIYDEFFYLQLGLLSKRIQKERKKTFVIGSENPLYEKALSLLPFELTGDQASAISEIKKDFLSEHPMNRMMQGDVGSGKTIVSFLSALFIIESGYQVAMMAPTEILAEQHYKNLKEFCDKLDLRIEILTGATKAKDRREILEGLLNGSIHILIGTHALITPDVLFQKLGYVIIDEQHRFGVLQRSRLKNKSKHNQIEAEPHLLIMTATPIPRTLSMCVYGDLDMTVIREMPKGRKPIFTKLFRDKERDQMYGFIQDEVAKGRQAYFVYPLIEESEKIDLKNATLMHKELKKVFKGFSVGLLHGKMKSQEKEEIMSQFKEGKIQVLVSTTVVEVGVDVQNSTVMVIEHAERFGLSQLHQLRGRVGRGAEKSYCFLVAEYAQSEESRYRLKTMEKTNDGFIIAEEDLKIRGPGEFLGTRQSGMPDFRLAHIIRDDHLLNASKQRAQEILSKDPVLISDENVLIRKIMFDRWGNRLDLSVV